MPRFGLNTIIMKKVFALTILLAFTTSISLPAFATTSTNSLIENGGDDKIKKKKEQKAKRKGQCHKVTSTKSSSTCCSAAISQTSKIDPVQKEEPKKEKK